MKCSLGGSNFHDEVSGLSHSIVFLYFFALITEVGFFILAVLWNSAFKWVYLSFSPLLFTSLLFTVICKASSNSHFPFCISFSWGWSWSPPPVQCHEPPSTDLSGTLTKRPNPLNLCITSIVESYQVIPEWSSSFHYFLQLKSEFGNKEFMIWATVSSHLGSSSMVKAMANRLVFLPWEPHE